MDRWKEGDRERGGRIVEGKKRKKEEREIALDKQIYGVIDTKLDKQSEREGDIKIDRELENMVYKGRGTQVEITTNRCIQVIQAKILWTVLNM